MWDRSTHRGFRGLSIPAALVAVAVLLAIGPGAAADTIVMFTASTDYTGDINGGASFPNDPVNQNPNLPGISSGVTLSPVSGGFGDAAVGPLDGVTYGPSGFNNNAGGSTGWVTSCYTFTTAGTYQIVWEVANVFGTQGNDALATDNITLNGNRIVDFSSGIPAGFNSQGSVGTSTGVTGLNPSGGDSAFAWMDVNPTTSTGVTPLFDTSGEVDSASQLYSTTITVKKNDEICIDAAFLTTSGSPYQDYAAIALQSVPEPSGLFLAVTGLVAAVGYASRRRRRSTRG